MPSTATAATTVKASTSAHASHSTAMKAATAHRAMETSAAHATHRTVEASAAYGCAMKATAADNYCATGTADGSTAEPANSRTAEPANSRTAEPANSRTAEATDTRATESADGPATETANAPTTEATHTPAAKSSSRSVEPTMEPIRIVEAAMEPAMHESAVREEASMREERPVKKAREWEKERCRDKPAHKECRRITPPVWITPVTTIISSAGIHNRGTRLRGILRSITAGIRVGRGLFRYLWCLRGHLLRSRRSCYGLVPQFGAPLQHRADLSRGQPGIAQANHFIRARLKRTGGISNKCQHH